MDESIKALNTLIQLTIIDLAMGRTVNNKFNAIKVWVDNGTPITLTTHNMFKDMDYSLKSMGTRSPFWRYNNAYMKLKEILKDAPIQWH